MAQVLTPRHLHEPYGSGKESYEVDWIIPNWREVRKSEDLVKCQEAVFKTTGSFPSVWFKTKWLVGLKLVPGGNSGRKVRVYWKLLGIKGTQSTEVEAKLQTQLLKAKAGTGSPPEYTDEGTPTKSEYGGVNLSDIVEETSGCLQFKPDSSSADEMLMSPSGEVRFSLKLTLKTPTLSYQEYERYKMNQFWKNSEIRQLRNYEELLKDHETADLKFLTSDGIEIPAHKLILKAQCPVFAAMLNCELSENATGIIRLTDITGKTMKILLHYFYTGELLPSWSDPDTIVEFTNAAGKYQMEQVLILLDDLLGRDDEGDIIHLDVQLIDLAGKLKLKMAEEKLLERIVAKIKKVGRGGEIFKLFGFEEEEIAELTNEKVNGSSILKIMGYLYGDRPFEFDAFYEKGMTVLALVHKEGMFQLEKKILELFAKNVDNVGNAKGEANGKIVIKFLEG